MLLPEAGDRSPSSAAPRKIVRDLCESRVTLPRVPDHVPLPTRIAGSAARACSQSICSACRVPNRPCLLPTGTHSANSRKQTGPGRGPVIRNRYRVLVAPGASVHFPACRCLKVTDRNRESWGDRSTVATRKLSHHHVSPPRQGRAASQGDSLPNASTLTIQSHLRRTVLGIRRKELSSSG